MEAELLKELSIHDIDNSLLYARSKGFDHTELIGVINRLSLSGYITTNNFKIEELVLTAEGKNYKESGSPEAQVFYHVKNAALSQAQIMIDLGDIGKIGFPQAMKNKWLRIDKQLNLVNPAVEVIVDKVQLALQATSLGEECKETENLVKRKLVENVKRGCLSISKGANYREEWVKEEADITYEMLKSGQWKTAVFKDYNFNALGKDTAGGHLHPLLKVRAQLRRILLDMGFEEMPTNNFIESSFWNFDSLFQILMI